MDNERCARCSNYLAICGHDLSFADKIKSTRIDTGWMPNAGSYTQEKFGGEDGANLGSIE